MSAQLDYWAECIASSLDEHGIKVTPEQLAAIARDVECAHDNYSMAFYQPENPLIGELASVKSELKRERELVICKTCGGRGRLIWQGPVHSADTQCWKCNGAGKHAP